MKTRFLRTGIELTELGVGAAQYGNLYRSATDADVAAAFEEAWTAGVRYFDTAPHYGLGLSERRLGRLLAQVPRDEVVVSSKVGRLLEKSSGLVSARDELFDVPAHSVRRWDFSESGVRRSVEESLERLGLERLDIVYLHDPDNHGDQAKAEAIPALAELRSTGIVGAVGAGMNQSTMLTDFVRHHNVDVVMIAGRYTLLEQGAAVDLLPAAREADARVIVAGAFNSGLLADANVRNDAKYDYGPASASLVSQARKLARICEEHGTTLPAAAVAFPLRDPVVASVVLGSRSAKQQRENIERYLEPVPDSLWLDLAERQLID